MTSSGREKNPRNDRVWTKPRKVNSPIILEDLMVKELPMSLEYSNMRKFSVRTEPTNEESTCLKQKICILNHLKNLIEVLRARFAITQGLNGKNITTVTNQYPFKRTLLNPEARSIFDLKLTGLRHETISNLILVMDHVVAYFGQKECLSKQNNYTHNKIEQHSNITTRQYVGLVHDFSSIMAHIPPLFNDNQQVDESELMVSLSNKAPIRHKAMLISQGFNP